MIHLNNYGWNDKLSQLRQESTYNALTHGRIYTVHATRSFQKTACFSVN